MDEKCRSLLLQNRAALAKDIKTSYIMDNMISDGVLTVKEEESVKAQATSLERANHLINLILEKNNRAYISFFNALLHEGYKDLASLLREGVNIDLSTSGRHITTGITSYAPSHLHPHCTSLSQHPSCMSSSTKPYIHHTQSQNSQSLTPSP
ncbi:apoptotic protease-activating factor 1 isoform X1 [Pelobates cultripes]|uniref:Apoptotic protease-activating factor 1 isoform X1 n=1 Tax=Pelobates cultripes TaxID=61616 RepID=A0AAD1RSF0_PELCU|nr:apoptotic protease-activating factor 1 isoform X1 [Pelobates cultripes]